MLRNVSDFHRFPAFSNGWARNKKCPSHHEPPYNVLISSRCPVFTPHVRTFLYEKTSFSFTKPEKLRGASLQQQHPRVPSGAGWRTLAFVTWSVQQPNPWQLFCNGLSWPPVGLGLSSTPHAKQAPKCSPVFLLPFLSPLSSLPFVPMDLSLCPHHSRARKRDPIRGLMHSDVHQRWFTSWCNRGP